MTDGVACVTGGADCSDKELGRNRAMLLFYESGIMRLVERETGRRRKGVANGWRTGCDEQVYEREHANRDTDEVDRLTTLCT